MPQHVARSARTDELDHIGWNSEFLSIEVPSRGNMCDSLSRTLAQLVKRGHLDKYKPTDFKAFSKRCSTIALRASYMIWLTRGSATIPDNQPLLV